MFQTILVSLCSSSFKWAPSEVLEPVAPTEPLGYKGLSWAQRTHSGIELET